MKQINKSNSLYDSIKSLIEESKAQIVRKVNTGIILTYYEIGRMIVKDEQSGKSRAEYADQTLKQLSIDLTRDFGKGFSHRNLKYFRKFYLNYCNRISQTPSANFSGSGKKRLAKAKRPDFANTVCVFLKISIRLVSLYLIDEDR